MSWYLRACPSCEGDLFDSLDEPEWVTCLLCGRTYTKAKAGEPRVAKLTRVMTTAGAASHKGAFGPPDDE